MQHLRSQQDGKKAEESVLDFLLMRKCVDVLIAVRVIQQLINVIVAMSGLRAHMSSLKAARGFARTVTKLWSLEMKINKIKLLKFIYKKEI
jgi:hypothetical protein